MLDRWYVRKTNNNLLCCILFLLSSFFFFFVVFNSLQHKTEYHGSMGYWGENILSVEATQLSVLQNLLCSSLTLAVLTKLFFIDLNLSHPEIPTLTETWDHSTSSYFLSYEAVIRLCCNLSGKKSECFYKRLGKGSFSFLYQLFFLIYFEGCFCTVLREMGLYRGQQINVQEQRRNHEIRGCILWRLVWNLQFKAMLL